MRKIESILLLFIFCLPSFAASEVEELAQGFGELNNETQIQSSADHANVDDPCKDAVPDLFNEDEIQNKMAILISYCEESGDSICTDIQSILPEIRAIDKIFNAQTDPNFLGYTFYLINKLTRLAPLKANGKKSRRISKELITKILQSLEKGYGLTIPQETYIIMDQIRYLVIGESTSGLSPNKDKSTIRFYAQEATQEELDRLKSENDTCYKVRKEGNICVNIAKIAEKAGKDQKDEAIQIEHLVIEDKGQVFFQDTDTQYMQREMLKEKFSYRDQKIIDGKVASPSESEWKRFRKKYFKDELVHNPLEERIHDFMNDLGTFSPLDEDKKLHRNRITDYLQQSANNEVIDLTIDDRRVTTQTPMVIHDRSYQGPFPIIDTTVSEQEDMIRVSPLFLDFEGLSVRVDKGGDKIKARFAEGFILPGLSLNDADQEHNRSIASERNLSEAEKEDKKLKQSQFFVEIKAEHWGTWDIELAL